MLRCVVLEALCWLRVGIPTGKLSVVCVCVCSCESCEKQSRWDGPLAEREAILSTCSRRGVVHPGENMGKERTEAISSDSALSQDRSKTCVHHPSQFQMLKSLKNLVIMIWERMKRKTKGDKSKMNFSLNFSDDLTEEKKQDVRHGLAVSCKFLNCI